jgi:hypothetical protein
MFILTLLCLFDVTEFEVLLQATEFLTFTIHSEVEICCQWHVCFLLFGCWPPYFGIFIFNIFCLPCLLLKYLSFELGICWQPLILTESDGY